MDVLFSVSDTAFETGYVVLNARQISLMPFVAGLLLALARNMAVATASKSKPSGWKGSWFEHRGQITTMYENQVLEPWTMEEVVPRGGVRRLSQGPILT